VDTAGLGYGGGAVLFGALLAAVAVAFTGEEFSTSHNCIWSDFASRKEAKSAYLITSLFSFFLAKDPVILFLTLGLNPI